MIHMEYIIAQENSQQTSSNKSSSASIGASFSTATGFSVNASALYPQGASPWNISAKADYSHAKGKGNSNSSDTTYTNSHLSAGNIAQTESGTDTTFAGASIQANQIIADVGTKGQGNFNMLVLNAATALADPAFRAAFLDQAKMYKKVPVTDDKGNTTFEWKEMTPEEKAKIPPGSRVANNGIFNGGPNDPKPAQDLANQNSSGRADYLIHFPQANNMISELLVAGYQKFLENSTTGLTNATQQNVDLWNQTGGNITLDGHSRGGMTVGNALTAIQEQGGAGGTTNVNLFGSAYNAQDAANTVNQVTDGKGQVKQSTNNYDLVGRLLGGNAGTGGSIPEGSSVFEEVIRTMGGAATVHNCYGRGNPGCDDRFGKDNNYSPPLVPVTPTNAGGRK